MLRRYINQRGEVREMRCDQGTYLVRRKKNELNASLTKVNTDSLKSLLLTQDCDLIEFKLGTIRILSTIY